LVGVVLVSSYNYLTPAFTQVPPPEAPVALFGADNNIVILDASLTEITHPRTAALTVTWQALQPLDTDYSIFLQAVTSDAASPTVVAQVDTQPLNGQRPATSWRSGEILMDTYQLDLSTVHATSGLRYYFGYYDWRDGRRLPLDGGIDDKLIFYGQ
jgi:hypothetical protein